MIFSLGVAMLATVFAVTSREAITSGALPSAWPGLLAALVYRGALLLAMAVVGSVSP